MAFEMLKIDIWHEAKDFITSLDQKRQKQLLKTIDTLASVPFPPRSKILTGYGFLRRLRSGDYRIIYFVSGLILNIVLIDKRNDDAIYRRLKQMFR